MDAAGDGAGTAGVEDDGWRGDAADGWRREGTALAHERRVGLHDLRECADYGGGWRRKELCERCEGGRPLDISGRNSAFDSGVGAGWREVSAGVQRWELQRV